MNPISNASFSDAYQISVAKKQLDGIKQQGRAALDLIQTAANGPSAAPAARVGSLVNVYALRPNLRGRARRPFVGGADRSRARRVMRRGRT
jgi:hypothetical protein